MLILLRAGRALSAPEVVARLERAGSPIDSKRPCEAVRQALGRELASGRVFKPARGTYAASGVASRTQKRWESRFPWLCG